MNDNKNLETPESLTNIKLRDTKSVRWDEDIENNVKEIGEKAKGYKIMHIQEARRISRQYKWLMYSGIILGPIAGLLSGIGAIINPSNGPVEWPIAAACTGFISGIVVAVTKFGKFEEKSSHHKLAASKYTSLESNVRRQLVLCRTERVNAAKYLEWIGNSFDDLFLASPLVARSIYTEYVKVAKENGLTVPDEYQLTINVNERYQLQKFNEMKDSSVININENARENAPSSPESELRKLKEPEIKKQVSVTFKGGKEIKRTQTLSHFPELNQFSDGRMGYEMQRMLGLK